MTELIVGMTYGVAGVGVYALSTAEGVMVASIVLGGTAVSALFLTLVAWRMGEQHPLLSALLIESAPTAVILAIAAGIGAFLIHLSSAALQAGGTNAPPDKQALSEAIGAVIVLGGSLISKAGSKATPQAMGRRFIRQYVNMFPEMPRAPGTALDAYRAITDASVIGGRWGVRAVRDRLERIRIALAQQSSSA